MMSGTTLIRAVNLSLLAIGESPVSTLEGAGSDAAAALAVIERIKRAHLSEGWDYNVEEDFPLTPEAFAPYELKVPDTFLSCVPMHPSSGLVQRGDRMFDRGRCTYEFKGIGTMLFRVVLNLDWEDVPEADKHLVATRASRIFAQNMVGDGSIVQSLTRSEAEAEGLARRQAGRSSRPNMLLDSWTVARALRR
jgi:hypothetical protein